jgi:hypothetical protein
MAATERSAQVVVCDAGPLIHLEVTTTLRSLPQRSTLHIRTSLLQEIIRQIDPGS